jgi:hypothetical protein
MAVTTTALLLLASVWVIASGDFRESPHGSLLNGVQRNSESPKGSCIQCHTNHGGGLAQPFGLFQENSNELCMSQSVGGCHADQPAGGTSGYPATEANRLPLGSTDPGYFEHNSAGIRLPGVNNLVRWPGRVVWQNNTYSPHYADGDMPIRDAFGNGSCNNCHDVHGGSSARDMLDTTYSGVAGSQLGTRASNFELCLSCHDLNGPLGMSEGSKYIADFYDRSINPGERSGHGVSSGSGYVPSGARLPCYDCHNPHGSQGYANGGPNGFLLSDERPGWYGLTDIQNDNAQVRRFCFGCHKSSDGQGGGQVEGMALEPLPTTPMPHAFNHPKHCYDCHGRDYSSPTSFNVHHPDEGNNSGNQLEEPAAGKIGTRRY